VPPSELNYIIGNPPFLGHHMQTEIQKEQLHQIFPTIPAAGVLDFVTAWYGKCADYIQGTHIKVGLVSTNSITQGEQTAILWRHLMLHRNIIIHFAHQTFRWHNDAPGKAAVYCVIIGFATFETDKKYLFTYPDIKGEAIEKEVQNINAYLVDAQNVFIDNTSKPICQVPTMKYGNKPTDGGNFLFTNAEKKEFLALEPRAEKFMRPFISAKEFLHNQKRWVLWLVDANPSDIQQLPHTLERVRKVQEFRLASKAKSTREYPHHSLFRQVTQPKADYILIPRTTSENRAYIPMAFLPKESIVSDTCQAVPDATLYHFGVLTSTMHMAWTRAVCGRLESRYRYSKDIVYNNFPWPGCGGVELGDTAKTKIEACAQAVLDARAQFPDSSLADLYDPLTMPAVLQKAHANLDRAVDQAYSYKDTGNEPDRLTFLFAWYQKIIGKEN
jgi:hypothetical protein